MASLPNVAQGDPHVAAHNDERAAVNDLKTLTETGRLSSDELNSSIDGRVGTTVPPIVDARAAASAAGTVQTFTGPAASPTGITLPGGLAFKKRWAKRHLFDLSHKIGEFDPYTENWLVAGGNNLLSMITISGAAVTTARTAGKLVLSNASGAGLESVMKAGQLNPFAIYDVVVDAASTGTAEAGLGFRYGNNDQFRVLARLSDGRIVLEARKAGTDQTPVTLGTVTGLAAGYTLRVHLNGTVLMAWVIDTTGLQTYVGSATIPVATDFRSMSALAGWTWGADARLAAGESVTIRSTTARLTGGCGQADPRVLTYRDGTPIVEGNKIWLTMTVRGGPTIPGSHQGIFSMDLSTMVLSYVGAILFDRGDRVLREDHAAKIFFDETTGEWCVMVPTHSDATRLLRCGRTRRDPRLGGFIVFPTPTVATIPVASGSSLTQGYEDAFPYWDDAAGKWRLVLCDLDDGKKTKLYESTAFDGTYTQISTGGTDETGQVITTVNGVRYVIAGVSTANPTFRVYSYPALTDLGTLSLDFNPNSARIWPCFVPIHDGNQTRYVLVSFDRGQVAGTYSYGALYCWEAAERGSGRDYQVTSFSTV